jgi:malonate transporter and related proteins
VLAVLAIVTPVFALMGLGYLSARLKYLPDPAGPALAQFAFKVAMPAMLFRAMLTAAPMQASPIKLLAAYFVAVIAIWIVATLIVTHVLRKPAEDQAPLAMASTFGNTVMLGIPIAVMAFGPEATTLLAIIIAVETPAMMMADRRHAAHGVRAPRPRRVS